MTDSSRIIATVLGIALCVHGLAGCSGRDQGARSDTTPSSGTSTPSAGGGLPAPAPGAAPAGVSPAMLATGDSIFHGLTGGGLCYTCHGADANGTPLAPSLVDTQWLTGDGGYSFLQQRITQGVPNPTPPYTGPMLPMGGAPLTPDQVKAVAAYVYSISHRSG